MPNELTTPVNRILEPIERISEVLFGVIMALSFTLTVGVTTADNIKIKAMLWAALGCTLAWGVIDGGVYLMTRVNESGRRLLSLKVLRDTSDAATARIMIADATSPLLASVVSSEQLDATRQKLQQLPDTPQPQLTKRDGLGALAVCLLSFLSTFPIVIPFLVIHDGRLALRASNIIAVAMLFVAGYAFGKRTGLQPWVTRVCTQIIH